MPSASVERVPRPKKALSFGADGSGQCRTKHMFFDDERIAVMREMILSRDVAQRERESVIDAPRTPSSGDGGPW